MNKILIPCLIIISIFLVLTPSITGTTDYVVQSTESETTKKIIVEAPLPRDLPADAQYWKVELKKITGMVKRHKATIDLTVPEYSFSRIEVPIENYESLVSSLELKGYRVHDEILFKPMLDESIEAIGGRYQWYNPEENTLTGAGKIITIIDSGIDCMHSVFNDCNPDGIGKILSWYDALYHHSDVPDMSGHGTHVASIAAGLDEEGIYTGVAPGAGLKIVRACTTEGCSSDDLVEAIEWAIEDGTDIISLSYGEKNPTVDMCTGSPSAPAEYKWVHDTIMDAIDNGIKFVAGAGNGGPGSSTVAFPACINKVISVGSTLKKDYECATDAEWGYKCWWHHSQTPVDTAIGYQIYVTSENEPLVWGGWSGSRNGWSGIQEVFEPNVWPVEIRVKVQGKNTLNACFPDPCWDICEEWVPGDPEIEGNPNNPEDDDEFWIWNFEIGYNPDAPYVVVELFNSPGSWVDWCWTEGNDAWHFWYPDDYTNIEDYVYVNAFRTNLISTEGLVVPTSGRGPAPQGMIQPDIVAPGRDICAARAYDFYPDSLYCGNELYARRSGTSMATPHVAGLVALLLEAYPDASQQKITTALSKADERIIEGNPDDTEGWGRINVQKAVNFITCEPDKTSLDGKCHDVCGADPECEGSDPSINWCDDGWAKECNWACGYTEEDCSPRAVDSDGGKDYDTWGECIKYQGCLDGNCKSTKYEDQCSGQYILNEYYVSGSSCVSVPIDCRNYGHEECKSGKCGTWTSLGGGGGGDFPGGSLMLPW